jgi:hypothetical protein
MAQDKREDRKEDTEKLVTVHIPPHGIEFSGAVALAVAA